MNRSFESWMLGLGLLLLGSLSPTAAQVTVMGQLSYDRQAVPGETYEGSIRIRNDGKEPTEVKVYQTDYLFLCDRTTRYDQPGTSPRSNAAWISLRPERLVVSPRETAEIRYTISIPAQDSLIGSYWSMVMIEEIGLGSPESGLRDTEVALGVQQILRYGVQLATHLAAGGNRSLEFRDVQLRSETDSTSLLEFSVACTGSLWMRPAVYAEVFDAQGLSQGTFAGKEYRMYPGTCVKQAIRLPKFPSGRYKALLVVDAGGEDVFGAQFTCSF